MDVNYLLRVIVLVDLVLVMFAFCHMTCVHAIVNKDFIKARKVLRVMDALLMLAIAWVALSVWLLTK